MKYRKKSVVVEAMQFDAEEWIYRRKEAFPMVESLPVISGSTLGAYFRYQPVIRTLEGDMAVSHDDYIVKGVQGEFYLCKPDVFESTYDLALDLL